MRILFNATAALPGTSGMAHTIGLLSQLRVVAPHHEMILLTTPDQTAVRLALSGVRQVVSSDIGGGALVRTARLQFSLGGIARAAGADMIYNKGNFHSPLAGDQISFIENSNPFSMLAFGEPLWYRTRNRLLRMMSRRALKEARAVIYPTEHMRRLVSRQSTVRSQTFVVGYGWEMAAPHGSPAAPTDRPYLLCVSSILPYKNLPIALEALRVLHDRRSFDGQLVIVGVSGVAGGGYYADVMRSAIAKLELERHVRMLPPVNAPELAALYRGAECLLMPSLEESFGIPLIEAMGIGVPVVAARVEGSDADRYFMPFSEICESAAEYFNPFDAHSCAGAIERATSAGRKAELVRLGRQRAEYYTWRAAAERTAAIFDALC
jgi:glycosyltransferase involved in cell wall biosynthesis